MVPTPNEASQQMKKGPDPTKIEVQTTFYPDTSFTDFLTEKINEESRKLNITKDAFPFGIFLTSKETNEMIAGANGSIVYGCIYTDQLWVHENHRKQGLGSWLMTKVEALGKENGCKQCSVATMSFQGAQTFYEKQGYQVEFKRDGYVNGSSMIYLIKQI